MDQENSVASVQNEEAQKALKKAEKARKSAEVLDAPTCLYRHYAADGKLLYIGISLSVVRRQRRHSLNSNWFGKIATIKVEWFPNRAIASAAERAAIKAEKPRYNIQYRKSRKRKPASVAEVRVYLNKLGSFISQPDPPKGGRNPRDATLDS